MCKETRPCLVIPIPTLHSKDVFVMDSKIASMDAMKKSKFLKLKAFASHEIRVFKIDIFYLISDELKKVVLNTISPLTEKRLLKLISHPLIQFSSINCS